MNHGKLMDRQCVPLVERLEPRLLLSAGDLDPTFGVGGWVATDFGATAFEQAADAVAVQADGKIVVAGFSNQGSTGLDFAVARYNPDGSLDTTGFGTGGLVTTDFQAKNDRATGIAIQPDGKILVAGYANRTYVITSDDFAVVRLNADGSLDSSFGTGGIAAFDLGNTNDQANAVVIQADGKIVLAGTKRTTSASDFAVVRLNDDGSLDSGFGTGGTVVTDLGSANDYGFDVALDSAGRIVVAGYAMVGTGGYNFAVVRLSGIDGSLDTTFGSGGVVITDFDGYDDLAFSVVVDGSDRIVAGGTASTWSDPDFALARYDTSGALDASFGTAGKVMTDVSGASDRINSLALSPDGSIVAAGWSQPGSGDRDFAVAVYNADGSLNTDFAGDGVAETDFGLAAQDYGQGVALDAGGNILVAGYGNQGATGEDFIVARYVGVAEPPSGVIQGMVWEDFNNDGEVNFGEKGIEGVTVTLTGGAEPVTVQTDSDGIYVFTDLAAGTYALSETQPGGYVDGVDVLGAVDGIVVGDDSVNDQFSAVELAAGSVAEDYNFGERPEAGGQITAGQTASIGFWKNKHGQALIESLNGGADSTLLGDWLAATFPNMYGVNAGANDLTGKTNTEVAEFYREVFMMKPRDGIGGPPKLAARVLGTAIATYVTNQTLVEVDYDTGDPDAGLVAAVESYDFVVTEYGLGICTFNVGDNGAAFGVDDNTEMTVLDILLATDEQTTNGVLYDLDGDGDANDSLETGLRTMAHQVYTGISGPGES